MQNSEEYLKKSTGRRPSAAGPSWARPVLRCLLARFAPAGRAERRKVEKCTLDHLFPGPAPVGRGDSVLLCAPHSRRLHGADTMAPSPNSLGPIALFGTGVLACLAPPKNRHYGANQSGAPETRLVPNNSVRNSVHISAHLQVDRSVARVVDRNVDREEGGILKKKFILQANLL